MTTSTTVVAQDGKGITTKSTFSRETSVSVRIQAKAEIVWALLTNASDFPRWNSTVISIDGKIAAGESIAVKVHLDPKRVFKLKVRNWVTNSQMTWEQGAAPFFKGVRTYTLAANADGSTTFTMRERMAGLMFPMAAGSIPDFKDVFTQYAADLKQEAEKIDRTK